MTKLRNNCTKVLDNNKKMSVAFLFNHSYFLGGGEISFFELVRKLDTKWFKPIAIVPRSGEIERKLSNHNIDVYIYPFPAIKSIYNGSPFIALIKLIKIFKRKKIQIIHANGSRVCLYAAIVGKILNIPIIWHVRETIRDIFWYDGLLGYLSSKIICVSKSVQRKRFAKFGSFIHNKIVIAYNGVDTRVFKKDRSAREKVRKELGIKSKILFGIVGNFVPLKGQNFFLRGFAEAKKRVPDLAAMTLLIGRPLNMAYYKSLIKLTKQLDIQSDIIYKPYCSNIQEILSALDVLALPSVREGFSRSMLEAMSCSLPIIATRISEIEEAITDKENGMLVDFMNLEKMAAAITTLCKNESLRNKIGKSNRLMVYRNYDLNSHARTIESLYVRISEEKTSNLN